MIVLCQKKIHSGLNISERSRIQALNVYQSVTSTLDHVPTCDLTFEQPWIICFSEAQTRGKGRCADRTWLGTAYDNLYFSAGLRWEKPGVSLKGFSLVVGMACVAMLKAFGLDCQLKWPNDLIHHYQKLGGILIEIHSRSPEITELVIGIGLNVNMSDTNTQAKSLAITQPWTSVLQITGQYTDRNHMAIQLIRQLMHHVSLFQLYGLDVFYLKWFDLDAYYHKHVIGKVGDQCYQGLSLGIDPMGHYCIQTSSGLKKMVSGSLRLLEQGIKKNANGHFNLTGLTDESVC